MNFKLLAAIAAGMLVLTACGKKEESAEAPAGTEAPAGDMGATTSPAGEAAAPAGDAAAPAGDAAAPAGDAAAPAGDAAATAPAESPAAAQ